MNNKHNIYENLKSDIEGLYSLSYKEDADMISQIIKNKYGNIKILDGTAGIGGNSISFGQYFLDVTSIEINKERFEYLTENIKSFNLQNKLINANFVDHLNREYDLLFIDPPWGGPNYKFELSVTLTIGDKSLIDIVNYIIKNKKIIVMKLPFNYNLIEFSNLNYIIYKIKNYQILIID